MRPGRDNLTMQRAEAQASRVWPLEAGGSSPNANDGAGVTYANPIAKMMAALDLVSL